MLLFSSILNLFIEKLNKKSHLLICIFLTILLVVYPFIAKIFIKSYTVAGYSDYIMMFAYLYFIAGYIKKYNVRFKKIYILYFIVAYLLQILIMMVDLYINDLYTVWNVYCAIFLLLIFKDLKFHSRFINKLAKTTFSIYLIHENNYVRLLLKNEIFPVFNSFVGEPMVACFVLAVVIFVICSAFDLIRINTIHKIPKKYYKKIDEKFNDFINK